MSYSSLDGVAADAASLMIYIMDYSLFEYQQAVEMVIFISIFYRKVATSLYMLLTDLRKYHVMAAIRTYFLILRSTFQDIYCFQKYFFEVCASFLEALWIYRFLSLAEIISLFIS